MMSLRSTVLMVLAAVGTVRSYNTSPILFPVSGGIKGSHAHTTCPGTRLDKTEFVQNMYVQYAEFVTDVPDMRSFYTCFFMKLDEVGRKATAINYSLNNNTNNDVITLTHNSLYPNTPNWELVVNGVTAYVVDVPQQIPGEWAHHCHSWSGQTGRWSVWYEGQVVSSGYSDKTYGMSIYGGGLLVTGQHQNTLGDGMDRGAGLIGGMTLLHFHPRALGVDRTGLHMVKRLATSCQGPEIESGVVGWLKTPRRTYGGVLTSSVRTPCRNF